MAQNQDQRCRSRVVGHRPVLESCAVGLSGLVLGNKKSAGPEAVATFVALRAVGTLATGKGGVVAIPATGLARATGGTPISISASHITNRSSSFRPSASTGRAKARRLAKSLCLKKQAQRMLKSSVFACLSQVLSFTLSLAWLYSSSGQLWRFFCFRFNTPWYSWHSSPWRQ